MTLNGVISAAIAYLTAKPDDFVRNAAQIFVANFIVQMSMLRGSEIWGDLELDAELFVEKVRSIWNGEEDKIDSKDKYSAL